MSPDADISEQLGTWVRFVSDRRTERNALAGMGSESRKWANESIAREARVTPSFVWSVLYRPPKRLFWDAVEGVRRVYVAELRREIERLRREIERAEETGGVVDSSVLDAARDLAAAALRHAAAKGGR